MSRPGCLAFAFPAKVNLQMEQNCPEARHPVIPRLLFWSAA